MLFNSYTFVFFFLPAVMAGFFILGRRRPVYAIAWLVAASLFFYAWWNPAFVLLLLASATLNYLAGVAITRRRPAKSAYAVLVVAVGANLALLGYFKYMDFFIETANAIDGAARPLANVILPLGVSFFTFTQVAFLVDAWRGAAREYQYLQYLLFVSYFPHLIAGPIIHHAEVMPQFQAREIYSPRADLIAAGVTLFILGLAKKVLLADYLADYANPVFDAARDGEHPQLLAAWAGAVAYTLQLYFDFSGYSDMAVGLSLLFGIRLPFNFDSPYRATSIIEFWRRWHMTLSRFLRDYLYVPLGGNRRGRVRRNVNVLVTMVLGGLWHGASWTFVAWGAIHGVLLVLNHGWRAVTRTSVRASAISMPFPIAVGVTFLSVLLAWVLFRSPNFETALVMWQGMAGMNGVSLPRSVEPLAAGLPVGFEGFFGGVPALRERGAAGFAAAATIGLSIVWLLPNSQQWMGLAVGPHRISHWRPTRAIAFVVGVACVASILHFDRIAPFLYYQF